MTDDESRTRRAYDDIIPVVMLQVEERIRETRHALRQEIAALSAKVQTAQLQQTSEHEQVRSDLADLKRSIEAMGPVAETVSQLRDRNIAETAQHSANAALRRTVWKAATLLVAVVAIVNGVVAVLVSH